MMMMMMFSLEEKLDFYSKEGLTEVIYVWYYIQVSFKNSKLHQERKARDEHLCCGKSQQFLMKLWLFFLNGLLSLLVGEAEESTGCFSAEWLHTQ